MLIRWLISFNRIINCEFPFRNKYSQGRQWPCTAFELKTAAELHNIVIKEKAPEHSDIKSKVFH